MADPKKIKPTDKLKHPSAVDEIEEVEKKPAARMAESGGVPRDSEGYDELFAKDGAFKETPITQHDFRLRSMISREALEGGDITVRGNLALVSYYRDGQRAILNESHKGLKFGIVTKESNGRHVPEKGEKLFVDIVAVANAEAFKKLIAEDRWSEAKMLESTSDAFSFGNAGDLDVFSTPGVVGPPNDEFIPLLGGPFSKQLYIYDYLDMHAKCFWTKNHHPYGAAIVRTLRSYIIGKGVSLMFNNGECQKVWDDFSERIDFAEILRSDTETLLWAGEIMTETGYDSAGDAKLTQIDPSTVWEIITDPRDIRVVLYYHQQYPTQWQLIYNAGDPSSEYVINDIPADRVIHIKDNVTPGEKRGRSTLFPVLSWLKRFRDYFNAKVVKALQEESWCLDVEIDGDQSDVDRIAESNDITRVPPPGSVRVHNKDVQYSYQTPTTASTSGRDNVGDQLRGVIATGAGCAPEWLGESSSGPARATALVKEGPANRNIEDKQQIIERYVRKVVKFVLKTAKANQKLPEVQIRRASLGALKQQLMARDWKGMLTEITGLLGGGEALTEPLDEGVEVIFPEADVDDRSTKISDIIRGESARYMTHERSATMYASEMNVTSYEYDEEMEKIDSEMQSGIGMRDFDQTEPDPEEAPEEEPVSDAAEYTDRNKTL